MSLSQPKGNIFVISGPSGTGKSTIRKKLLSIFPHLKFSVSYTTRPLRKEEKEGIDYHLISHKQFEEMINKGEFAEWAEVHGHLYGTPAQPLKSAIAKGEDILLEIDVQGGEKIKTTFPEAVLIFILPPNFKELENRIHTRAMDNQEEIKRRLQIARREIIAGKNYHYLVLNDSLEHCLQQIKPIIISQSYRTERQISLLNKIIANS